MSDPVVLISESYPVYQKVVFVPQTDGLFWEIGLN
jgi:hypothetical protein